MPEQDDTLPDAQVADLVDRALGVKAGTAFHLGPRTVQLDFLRLDAEQDLADMIVAIIKKAPALDLAEVLSFSTREVTAAAALILADYDHPDAQPGEVAQRRAEAAAWIRSTRGVTTRALVDLVLAQIAMNGLGELLGKLWTALAPLAAIAVRHHPPTSPASGSSAGPGSGRGSPSA